MTTTTKILLIICGTLAMILAFNRFGYYRESQAEKLFQGQISALKAEISKKEKSLAESEKRLTELKGKYRLSEAKLKVITKPQTITETKERLTAMKYDVLPGENVSVSDESGKQIVVDLEKGKVCNEALAACKQITSELEGQKSDLMSIIDKKDEQIKINEAVIADQKQVIKENKPSAMDGIIKVLGGIGIGLIIGLIL